MADYDSGGEKKDLLATARRRWLIGIDANKENRESQIDDVRFAAGSPDNGWQWPDDVRTKRETDPNGARPTLTVNKLPQHIRLVTNEQRQNRRSIKVLPVDSNADEEVARILNGICRHIEIRSHAEMSYDIAAENQVTMGEGYWRVLTEYTDEMSFEQDILIAPIRNSFSVVLDPDGLRRDSTGRKCEWGFISDTIPNDDYKRMFPNAKSKTDWEALEGGQEVSPWFDGENVRIAEYFYAEYEKKTICLWPDNSVSVKGEMPANALYAQPLKERITNIRKIRWCKINGFEELESREWPGKTIPIVRCVGNEYDVEGSLIVSGAVRNAKDACRMYNYWVSQEAEFLALAPKAPFVGAVGQFETMGAQWATANNVNYSRLEYDPIDVNGQLLPPPQRQAPPIPPAGIISAKMGASDDIQATLGQYNPSIGAEAKEKSGKAIVARQRQADVGTFHYLDNQSRAIQYTGEILIDLAPKIFDTKRVARIIGEDGEASHVMLDPDQPQGVVEQPGENGIEKIYNLGVGRFDVVVVAGPSYTTKRMEAAEGMAMVLQSNPQLWQVVGDIFVKNMDWPGADEFAKRIRKTIPAQLLEDPANKSDPDVQQAKEALTKANAKVSELNSEQENLEAQRQLLAAERRELGLARQLAEEQIRNAALTEASNVKGDQIPQIVERLMAIENMLGAFEVASQQPPNPAPAAVVLTQ